MSSVVETGGSRRLAVFRPEDTKRRDAVLGYAIEYARRVKDWPALYAAVEEKIQEQAEFVSWWRENVSKRHGAGRGNKKNADLRSFSVNDAEAETGIRQQQVSRWAKRLQNREKYRELLYGSAYRKAMMEAVTEVDNHRAQGTGVIRISDRDESRAVAHGQAVAAMRDPTPAALGTGYGHAFGLRADLRAGRGPLVWRQGKPRPDWRTGFRGRGRNDAPSR